MTKSKKELTRLKLMHEFDGLAQVVDSYDIVISRLNGEEREEMLAKRDILIKRMHEIDETLIERTY